MSQQYEQFEQVNESVMARTIEGAITYWNSSAENLYGWTKQEAVGKVSHNLLCTKFPKPLKEIESELLRNKVWEGKLIHTTRDGRQVHVKSRWSIELDEQSGPLVEINRPCAAQCHEAEVARNRLRRGTFDMRRGLIDNRNVLIATAALLATLTAIWTLYSVSGHYLLSELYHSPKPGIADLLMPGRAETPLEQYYYGVSWQMIMATLWTLGVYLVAVAVLKQPIGFVVSTVSFFVCSVFLFSVLELFPPLAQSLGVSQFIPYYAYKLVYLPDDQLAFREKPWRHDVIPNYRIWGEEASLNGIDEPARRFEWVTDGDGFRNSPPKPSADIVVLGDSFVEYGDSNGDTFPSRLERQLPGWSVANLGKSGYGPFQYLEVLKRYGIQKKPAYALFSFYEGNDISDIRNYTEWRNNKGNYNSIYQVGSLGFLERYYVALRQTARLSADAIGTGLQWTLTQLLGIHYQSPDLVVIRAEPGRVYKTSFADTFPASAGNDLLASKEWMQLRNLLEQFKATCQSHGIVPIVLYIPATVTVYAPYTTPDSGVDWLSMRSRQIASRQLRVDAMMRLTQELGIEMINLLPEYDQAASHGEMLYELFNAHWNAAGRELAARVVARRLERESHSSRPHTEQGSKTQAHYVSR